MKSFRAHFRALSGSFLSGGAEDPGLTRGYLYLPKESLSGG